MPEFDISVAEIEDSDQLPAVNLKLLTVMLWPADEAMRRSVTLSKAQDAMERRTLDTGEPLVVMPEFLARRGKRVDADAAVRDALSAVVIGAAKTTNAPSRTAGQVAGSILLKAFELQYEGEQNVSLNKSLELLFADYRLSKGGRRRDDLIKHWHAFQSVAHYWAADIATKSQGSSSTRLAPLWDFIVRAEQYGRRGARIKNKHAYAPLLDADTLWKMPTDVFAKATTNLMFVQQLVNHGDHTQKFWG